MLEKQTVPIVLGQGVDTKTDPKGVVAGKLIVLQNGTFVSPKRIKKRNGGRELGRGIVGSVAGVTVGQGLASYFDELCLFDKSQLYSYDASNDAWLTKGAFSSVHVTQRPVVRNTYRQTAQDSTTHSVGLQCFAWEDSQGGVRYSVVDSATGLSVASNQLVHASASRPKVVALGNNLLVFYVVAGTTSLYYLPIGVTSPTTPGAAVLVTNELAGTRYNYDVSIIGERAFVAWNKAGGVIEFQYLLTTLAASATVVITEAASNCLTLFADSASSNVVLAWHTGNFVRQAVYTYGLALVSAPVTVETTINVTSITGVATPGTTSLYRLFYARAGVSAADYTVRTSLVTNHVPGAPSTLLRSVGLGAKAFAYDGKAYVVVSHESGLQSTYFVADEAGSLVAKVFYGLGGGIPTRSMLAEVSAVSATQFQTSCLVKDLLVSSGGNVFTQTGVNSVTFDFFDAADSYLRAELGENLHVGGGFVEMYDGVSPVEHGFHLFPEGLTAVSTPAVPVGEFNFSVAPSSANIMLW